MRAEPAGSDKARMRGIVAAMIVVAVISVGLTYAFWPKGVEAPHPSASSVTASSPIGPGGSVKADDETAALVSPGPELKPGYASLTPEMARALNERMALSAAPNPAARPFSAPAAPEARTTALRCLAEAVYYEAGFEPLQGRRAVAQVVLNRVRHGLFPKTVCGVVFQGAELPTGCQFTFTCGGAIKRAPVVWAWREAVEVATRALAGYVEPSVGGATHYHAVYVYPFWAPTLFKVSKIGAHVFYRWPGGMGLPAAFAARYAGNEPPLDLRYADWLASKTLREAYALEGAFPETAAEVDVAAAEGVSGQAQLAARLAAPEPITAAQSVVLSERVDMVAPDLKRVQIPQLVLRRNATRDIPIGVQSACAAGVVDSC